MKTFVCIYVKCQSRNILLADRDSHGSVNAGSGPRWDWWTQQLSKEPAGMSCSGLRYRGSCEETSAFLKIVSSSRKEGKARWGYLLLQRVLGLQLKSGGELLTRKSTEWVAHLKHWDDKKSLFFILQKKKPPSPIFCSFVEKPDSQVSYQGQGDGETCSIKTRTCFLTHTWAFVYWKLFIPPLLFFLCLKVWEWR